MKILAIEKEIPGINPDDYLPYLREEAGMVWEFQQNGLIREIYFSEDHSAILILECKDKPEAGSILSRLPLVQKGLIAFELIELHPYNGFERLFS
jgi:hypothetical protein